MSSEQSPGTDTTHGPRAVLDLRNGSCRWEFTCRPFSSVLLLVEPVGSVGWFWQSSLVLWLSPSSVIFGEGSARD